MKYILFYSKLLYNIIYAKVVNIIKKLIKITQKLYDSKLITLIHKYHKKMY